MLGKPALLLLFGIASGCTLLFEQTEHSDPYTEGAICVGGKRSFDLGASLGPTRFEHVDLGRGTITFWALRLVESNRTPLVNVGGITVESDTSGTVWVNIPGGGEHQVPQAVEWSNEDYQFFALRWDSQKPLSGSSTLPRHVELRVGTNRNFLADENWSPPEPDTEGSIEIGSSKGHFEVDQLVVYGRPLYVDADAINGRDELRDMAERHSNSASFAGGAIEIDFSSAAPRVQGCDDYEAVAWRRPIVQLLPGDFRGGDDTGWTIPLPIEVPAEELVYESAVGVSVAAAITTQVDLNPGGNYFIRALATPRAEGLLQLEVRALSPKAGSAMLISEFSSAGPGPVLMQHTFSMPNNASDALIYLSGKGDDVYIHDIQLLPNLLANAGMEEGADEDPALPAVWDLDPGSERTDAEAYGGTYAACLSHPSAPTNLSQAPASLVDHQFYAFGAAVLYRGGDSEPAIAADNGSFFAPGRSYFSESKVRISAERNSDAWQLIGSAARRLLNFEHNNNNDLLRFGAVQYNDGESVNMCLDETYAVPLQRILGASDARNATEIARPESPF